MSAYHITMSQGKKVMIPVTTEEEFRALRDSDRQKENLLAARQGSKSAKDSLLQMNYSCIPDSTQRLKGCKTASNSVAMDIDCPKEMQTEGFRETAEFKQWMQEVEQKVMAKREQLGLLLLEQSCTKGFHVVFARQPQMTQEENLRWASDLLEVEYDSNAKDITRVLYTTTSDELIFLSPQLFNNEAATTPALLEETATTAETPAAATTTETPATKTAATPAPASPEKPQMSYKGVPCEVWVKTYLELYNDGKEPTEGDRNAKTFEMAMIFRHICNYDLEQLKLIVPRYDNFPAEEYEQTLRNALKEPRKGIPYRLTAVEKKIKEKRQNLVPACKAHAPQLPEKIPTMMKLICSNVPDMYKPSVCESIWPALATHLHEVTFRYLDGTKHEPGFMSVCIAPMSIGKGYFKTPQDLVLEKIYESDKANRETDAAWRQTNKQKAANQKREPRPEGLYWQVLMSNITPASLLDRLKDCQNAEGRPVYFRLDEIELFNRLGGNGIDNIAGEMIRLGYDRAEYGAERVGIDSVSGVVKVRLNFNVSTTPDRGKSYMKNWVNDGTLSRLQLCTIELPENFEDDEFPQIKEYNAPYRTKLGIYVGRIASAKGLVECTQVNELLKTMKKESAQRMKELVDPEPYRVLSYRALRTVFDKGMLLYIANGFRWSAEIETYLRWSYEYDMWCKLKFFGEDLSKKKKIENQILSSYQPTLIDLMPNPFSEEQLEQKQRECGNTGKTKDLIRAWRHRNKIVYDEVSGLYYKVVTA